MFLFLTRKLKEKNNKKTPHNYCHLLATYIQIFIWIVHFIVLCLKENYAKVRFVWMISPLSLQWWQLLLVASRHLLSCFVIFSKVFFLPHQSCPFMVQLFTSVPICQFQGLSTATTLNIMISPNVTELCWLLLPLRETFQIVD